MINVLYVHGYGGKGNGDSAISLRNRITELGLDINLISPDIPIESPDDVIELIKKECRENDIHIIIASSLGAFYSMNVVGPVKILINPAMPNNLFNVNPDIDLDFIFKLNEIKKEYFDMVYDLEVNDETNIILGSNDDIAPNKKLIYEYFHNVVEIPMGHRLDEIGIEEVCKELKEIKEKIYEI